MVHKKCNSFAHYPPVVFFCLIHDLVNACLRLGHLAGSPHLQGLIVLDMNGGGHGDSSRGAVFYIFYLDVPLADKNPVHLVEGKLGSLRLFKLNKCKTLAKILSALNENKP